MKQIGEKMIPGWSGSLLPRKIFEIHRYILLMGILGLFEQFVMQVLFFCP